MGPHPALLGEFGPQSNDRHPLGEYPMPPCKKQYCVARSHVTPVSDSQEHGKLPSAGANIESTV